MIKAKNAVYSPNTVHEGNPLIEALPPYLNSEQLREKLLVNHKLPRNYKSLSPQDRVELTERIRTMFIPLDFSMDIYTYLRRGLCSSYEGKNIIKIKRQLYEVGCAMKYKQLLKIPNFDVQADCFSVVGESGMGKTETMRKILECYPQIIQHEKYKNIPIPITQIPCITIECPANISIKGACFQIISKICDLAGVPFEKNIAYKETTVDALICHIANLCLKYCVGAIIIDEIQNIIAERSKQRIVSSPIIRFLVELSNKTGICLVCIGTPKVEAFFRQEEHLFRRTRGPRISALVQGSTYHEIVSKMWEKMAVMDPMPLDDEIEDLIYKISGGILDKISNLIVLSARDAIYFGVDHVDLQWLKRTAVKYGIAPAKRALDTESPELFPDKQAKKKPAIKRGRPAAVRDPYDILNIYNQCQENGVSVSNRLVAMGLAEEIDTYEIKHVV